MDTPILNLKIEDFIEKIPQYVIDVAETLQKHNFEAFLVGGSVRDLLLNTVPRDFDVATNAYPDQIQKIFNKSIAVGAQFGTITAVVQDEKGESFDVEITTYRSDGDYTSGRWPTKVEFTKTIEEDLARRDFTINAIALNLQKFDESANIQEILIDPFFGIRDLENKTIKAVRDPLERFSEDGLRAVRACRLASQLEFEIEESTFSAISKTIHITKLISIERFRDEFTKILYRSPKPSVGIELLRNCGILEIFIPELLEGIDVVQPIFHADDVYRHSLKACDIAEDEIKLAALFHDIAKPRTKTEDEKGIHFYKHDTEGEKLVKEILTRLRFPKYEVTKVATLVRWHMFYYPSAEYRKEDFEYLQEVSSQANKYKQNIVEDQKTHKSLGWSDGAIRRFIKNVGSVELIEDLFKLRIADARSNGKNDFNIEEVWALSYRISNVMSKEMALKITDLDINGTDLMNEFGIEGKTIGYILKNLLEIVIDNPILNKKETLILEAKKIVEQTKNKV